MAKKEFCPVCHKSAVAEHIPFCSKRCTEIDLGKWFTGSYAVAAVESDDEPDDEETAVEQ